MSALPSPVPFVIRHEDETHVPQSFILSDDGRVALLRGEARKANAAFIVRACNSHAALVEALENILVTAEYLDRKYSTHSTAGRLSHNIQVQARAALALAKGGQQ